MLDNNEVAIIRKVLQGNGGFFDVFSQQILDLNIINRQKENGRYLVEFGFSKSLKDSNVNLEIDDTCLWIKEVSTSINITLTILDGYTRYLDLAGDYDFQNKFTINNFFWQIWDANKKQFIEVLDSSERNYESAISYIPVRNEEKSSDVVNNNSDAVSFNDNDVKYMTVWGVIVDNDGRVLDIRLSDIIDPKGDSESDTFFIDYKPNDKFIENAKSQLRKLKWEYIEDEKGKPMEQGAYCYLLDSDPDTPVCSNDLSR